MPTARQSVLKRMSLAREPKAIGRYNLFLGDVGIIDFSMSIGIHLLPPEILRARAVNHFLHNSSRVTSLSADAVGARLAPSNEVAVSTPIQTSLTEGRNFTEKAGLWLL